MINKENLKMKLDHMYRLFHNKEWLDTSKRLRKAKDVIGGRLIATTADESKRFYFDFGHDVDEFVVVEVVNLRDNKLYSSPSECDVIYLQLDRDELLEFCEDMSQVTIADLCLSNYGSYDFYPRYNIKGE